MRCGRDFTYHKELCDWKANSMPWPIGAPATQPSVLPFFSRSKAPLTVLASFPAHPELYRGGTRAGDCVRGDASFGVFRARFEQVWGISASGGWREKREMCATQEMEIDAR